MLLHFFLVKLKANGAKRQPEIMLRFRALGATVDFTASEPVLSAFCFPLGPEAVPPKEYMASEEYTFTLTHGDGKRFQGFCRKVLPPPPKLGSKLRLPQVLCVISEYPWCLMYFKVLQVMEQLLRSGDGAYDRDPAQLPAGSDAFKFLQELGTQLNNGPSPGQMIRIPFPKGVSLLGVSPPRSMSTNEAVRWEDDSIELQVPPDCGNGKWNCGVSLARLLWHVPVSAMLTLISSMLLERRIIIIGSSRDTVTAAVQAAAALLYPFRWHHIYLPLLPKQLKDYLAAPMPFIVGLPAQMLSALKGLSVDEVTLVDLDLGKCDPAPNSARDDAVHLPWREKLESALAAAYAQLRSPTEFESSPLISGIMQEYFLKLVGNYHNFVHEDSPSHAAAHSRTHAAAPSSSRRDGGEASGRDNRDHGDTALRGHGQAFEQDAFIAHFRRNEKAKHFLSMFRHSQMYEVFIQERLERATQHPPPQDAFEQRLIRFKERRKARRQARLGINQHQPTSRMSALLLKKQRPDSMVEESRSKGQNKSSSASNQTDAIDPASFFEDGSDSDWVYDRDLLTREPDSPGRTRDLRTCSAMPTTSDMQHLREFQDGRTGPMRHSGSRPDLRADLGGASDSVMEAAAKHQHPPGLSMGPKAAGAGGSMVFSFQSGDRHYEGNLTSVMKAMWSDRSSPTQPAPSPAAAAGAGAAAPRRSPDADEGHHFEGVAADRSSLPELAGRFAAEGSASAAAAQAFCRQKTIDMVRPRSSLVQRYMPVSGGLSSLMGLEGGKLKQPPAPSRPLHVAQPPATTEVLSMTSLAEAGEEVQQAPAPVPGLQAGSGGPVLTMAAGNPVRDLWDPFGNSASSSMKSHVSS